MAAGRAVNTTMDYNKLQVVGLQLNDAWQLLIVIKKQLFILYKFMYVKLYVLFE